MKKFDYKLMHNEPETNKQLISKMNKGKQAEPKDITCKHFLQADKISAIDFFLSYPEVKLHFFFLLFPGAFRRMKDCGY
jgi:hypothetical protein